MGINLKKPAAKTLPSDYSNIEFYLEFDIDGQAIEYAYLFDFNYTEGRQAKVWAAPEDCYPEESAEIEITECQQEHINGQWYDVDYQTFEDLLIEAAFEHVAKEQEAEREAKYAYKARG